MSDTFTGTIGHGPIVETVAAHRSFNDTPVAVQVTMSVPMSYDDLVAALWVVVDGGYRLADVLADDTTVSALILDTLLNGGNGALEDARITIDALRPGCAAHQVVAQLRDLVARLYGPAVTAPQPRRELAGVTR